MRPTGALPPASPTAWACRRVAAASKLVHIDPRAIARVAGQLAAASGERRPWGHPYITLEDGPAAAVVTTTLLNAVLQFSFWPDSGPRWAVDGQQGSFGVTWAIRRAFEAGIPVADPRWLASASDHDLAAVFAGDAAGPALPPLWQERVTMIRDLGRWLASYRDPVAALAHHRDAYDVAAYLTRRVPGFRDSPAWTGEDVPFNKKAQLAVSLLRDLLGERAPRSLRDQERLTAFADYRLPQILNHLGVLRYAPQLRRAIARGDRLEAGSAAEVEIRAATVTAVEDLVAALRGRGQAINAAGVDAALWKLAERDRDKLGAFHLCRTLAY